MGRPVARWHGLGKYLSIVVVLCFFLPFFGISCDGVDVLHVSGADMALGCAPGGMLVAHGALDAIAPFAAEGDATLVAYTPPGAAVAFGVLWWQPGPRRALAARRALSPERPHVDHTDLEAARTGTLPPL